MRGQAAVGTNLNEALGIAGSPEHGRAFAQGVTDGFFYVDVGAGLERSDDGKGVPVVWRGDDADLGFFFGEHLAVVAVVIWPIARELCDFGGCCGHGALVDIANACNFRLTRFHRAAEDVVAPPACSDNGGAVPGTVLRPQGRRHK